MCKKDNVSQNIIDAGKKICEQVNNNNILSSSNPSCLGATIFYIACKSEGILSYFQYASRKMNISEITLRSLYYKILKGDKNLAEKFKEINDENRKHAYGRKIK
jgi:transcription initiation factor TFIIIB Brf1 subunit/transcription initiation factor TFIIB